MKSNQSRPPRFQVCLEHVYRSGRELRLKRAYEIILSSSSHPSTCLRPQEVK